MPSQLKLVLVGDREVDKRGLIEYYCRGIPCYPVGTSDIAELTRYDDEATLWYITLIRSTTLAEALKYHPDGIILVYDMGKSYTLNTISGWYTQWHRLVDPNIEMVIGGIRNGHDTVIPIVPWDVFQLPSNHGQKTDQMFDTIINRMITRQRQRSKCNRCVVM